MKENYPTLNFGEFRKTELMVYNATVNNFSKTFDLSICNYVPDNYGKIFEIRDYHDISESGKSFLLTHKDNLKFFQIDYYAWKSPKDISDCIGQEIEKVLVYAKKYFMTDDGKPLGFASIGPEGYNIDSRTNRLSSFQILRDIQMDNRFQQLKKMQKKESNF